MSMEYWWNDTDKEKAKYAENTPSWCHLVHHKSYTDWPGIEYAPPKLQTGN